MWTHHRGLRAGAEAEHRAALVGFYAAVTGLAGFYAFWAEVQPKRDNLFTQTRLGVQLFGWQRMIVDRLLHVIDQFWIASGRILTVASDEELAVIHDLEALISEWDIGEPLPETWAPAVHRLRRLVEGRDNQGPSE
jgi:hypothetical protein